MRNVLMLMAVSVLAACGTARTLVLEPVADTGKFSRADVIAHNPTVEVPAEVTAKLEAVVNRGLYESGAFQHGPDLRIFYTFVSHDAGDRFARWFWGGIGNAGEGSVTLMVRYVDQSDRELAKTQVEGRIGSGFFGGSMDEAITKAGEEVVKFTVDRFSEAGPVKNH